MDIICLVCREPHENWIHFLNNFNLYKVYIVINNNNFIIPENYEKKYKIKFIKIDDKICYSSGFNNANRCENLPHFPEITSWDKALYYFSSINLNYTNVWFIEDDCFFINENTIKNINNKYPTQDLLTRNNDICYEESPEKWHWKSITSLIPSPRASSLIQTCRLSKRLLEKINEYASINKRLILIEAMFNTLALQNHFSIECPFELSKLELINYDKIENVDEIHIYHALKNMNKHKEIRDLYNRKKVIIKNDKINFNKKLNLKKKNNNNYLFLLNKKI